MSDKQLRIYVSGPMTGYYDWNRSAFAAMSKQLREQGHVVFNPGESFGGDASLSWHDFMRHDIGVIMHSIDAVVTLPGWEDSKGAQVEVTVAKAIGLPIYNWDDEQFAPIFLPYVARQSDLVAKDHPDEVKAEHTTAYYEQAAEASLTHDESMCPHMDCGGCGGTILTPVAHNAVLKGFSIAKFCPHVECANEPVGEHFFSKQDAKVTEITADPYRWKYINDKWVDTYDPEGLLRKAEEEMCPYLDCDQPNGHDHEVLVVGEPESILDEANRVVNGPRRSAYGHPLDNFGRIVALWNAYLAEKLKAPLTEEDHAILLILTKVARLIETPDHRDSHVDIAGYAQTISLVQQERARRRTEVPGW